MTLNNKRNQYIKSFRDISRMLTVVENRLTGANDILQNLNIPVDVPVLGITGPPGAGKSTLVSALISELLEINYRIAVLAVDPTSPFNFGALLGDRIRMQSYATNPKVFIRSIASRGFLGGLSPRITEMTNVLRSSGFDMVIVETVGIGQSELEIAALADLTLLVLVPESGDEIQLIKSGIMEVADAYVVNKADRPGADQFLKHLEAVAKAENKRVFKTVASAGVGISDLVNLATNMDTSSKDRSILLMKRAWNLIQEARMSNLDKAKLQREIATVMEDPDFNFYRFVQSKI